MENNNSTSTNDQFLDFSKSNSIITKDGSPIWTTGYILREFPPNNPSELSKITPIQVFYNSKTGEILENFLPEEIKNEYNTTSPHYKSTQHQENPNTNSSWGKIHTFDNDPLPENTSNNFPKFQWKD